jgi:hypothetical protein
VFIVHFYPTHGLDEILHCLAITDAQ